MCYLSEKHFKNGLAQARQQKTAQTLGDRSTYVGSSDIGQCPRKAVLSKIAAKEPDLATLIRFERGHIVEDIVASAIQAENPDRQVELATDLPYCPACHWWSTRPASGPMYCPDCGNPLRVLPLTAHCDFVFDDNLILECKSSQTTDIQKSWEMQLQTQMLLYEHCLGKSPHGGILVMDLARGWLKIADSYVTDPVMVPAIIQRGIEIWEGVEEAMLAADPETLNFKTEPSPLCGWCDYLATCPAFQGEKLPDQLVGFFEEYVDFCRTEKEAKTKKDALRDQVLAMLEPGKYMAGDLRVSLSERSRTTTDMKAISALLTELGQDITEYQNKTAYRVLDVKKAA